MTVLDTKFKIPPQWISDPKGSVFRDSGFLDLDSGFQTVKFWIPKRFCFMGFRIPRPGFRIPKSWIRIPRSTSKYFLDFGFLDLDSGSKKLDSGFHIPHSTFHKQIFSGFWIPRPRFRIPKSWIPDSTSKYVMDFRFREQ